MRRSIKIGSKTVPLWLLFIVSLVVTVCAASVIFGVVNIGYRITPTTPEAPTMSPDPLNLDLGDIPSGTSDVKDFGKVATLTLPAGYEVTFTLDLATSGDFTTFDVWIHVYEAGADGVPTAALLKNQELWNSESLVLAAGVYDVQVKISYTAVSVTSETTGSVLIDVSYPG